MIWLILGAVTLMLLLGLMRGFARAPVADIKALIRWVTAIGGVLLALMLIITGRGGFALFGITFLLPLFWDHWGASFFGKRGQASTTGEAPRAGPGGMSRDEAYQVLGLKPGASKADIKAAHRRLMAAAHPDHGGSDWIAARLNQARDVLMG
jgi:DnaJ homolog subfamily C member 19